MALIHKELIFPLSVAPATLCGAAPHTTRQINSHANERVHALAFALAPASLRHNWTLINAPTCSPPLSLQTTRVLPLALSYKPSSTTSSSLPHDTARCPPASRPPRACKRKYLVEIKPRTKMRRAITSLARIHPERAGTHPSPLPLLCRRRLMRGGGSAIRRTDGVHRNATKRGRLVKPARDRARAIIVSTSKLAR